MNTSGLRPCKTRQGRINRAALLLLASTNKRRDINGDLPSQTRAFDDCFEMGDGDQVFAGLIEKSRTSERLAKALADDFGDRYTTAIESTQEPSLF